MFTEALKEIGKARLVFGVGDDKVLLGLPNPAGGVALDGRFGAGDFFAGDARFQNVEAHDIFDGVVKDEREEIEVDDGMETAGKVVEKRGEIALLGDGLADFKQGFELTPGMFERRGEGDFGRGNDGFRHRRQDNTWVGEGSTAEGAGEFTNTAVQVNSILQGETARRRVVEVPIQNDKQHMRIDPAFCF